MDKHSGQNKENNQNVLFVLVFDDSSTLSFLNKIIDYLTRVNILSLSNTSPSIIRFSKSTSYSSASS